MNDHSFIIDSMRTLDLAKRAAICDSAVRLINRLGFHGVSIAKIAKDAGVSPASIYIYFEDKTDMLQQIYLNLKEEMVGFVMAELNPDDDYVAKFRHLFLRQWDYFLQNTESFAFIEQFANSPLLTEACATAGSAHYAPLRDLVIQAQQDGVIRPMTTAVFNALVFSPLLTLAKQHANRGQTVEVQELEQVFDMIWTGLQNPK